jgi:hypothetical protein
VFEALSLGNTLPEFTATTPTSPNQQHPPTVDGVPDQSVLIDVENLATIPTVIIDKFPTGNPGAPIPDMPQHSHAYESQGAMPGDSVWAPFRSQRDWEVARWAKMCGPTSSALTELLAIPGVCASYRMLYHVANTIVLGRRHARPFISHSQQVERFH